MAYVDINNYVFWGRTSLFQGKKYYTVIYFSIMLASTFRNVANAVFLHISALTRLEQKQGTHHGHTLNLVCGCLHLLIRSIAHYFQTVSVVKLELYCCYVSAVYQSHGNILEIEFLNCLDTYFSFCWLFQPFALTRHHLCCVARHISYCFCSSVQISK